MKVYNHAFLFELWSLGVWTFIGEWKKKECKRERERERERHEGEREMECCKRKERRLGEEKGERALVFY